MQKTEPQRPGARDVPEEGSSGSDRGARERMAREVREGLSRVQKELSPKWFYDHRGSELFERITRLPEYYPTRTERGLLERWAPDWFAELEPEALVELGAGSALKTHILLDAMHEVGSGGLFVPLDVSERFLEDSAARLREEYPSLSVHPEVADLNDPLELSVRLPGRTLFALLGSTIGNFEPDAAVRVLGHVRARMGSEDRFLMGADLRPGPGKSVARLERAYDDSEGVTAAFNRNVLHVLNRELGTDFDPRAFRHRAFWNDAESRIEMHLVAERPQRVTLPGGATATFSEGESVRTEISCKYDRPRVEALFEAAGLVVRDWREDDEGLYALVLAGPA